MSQPPDNITVVPNENNLSIWEVTIAGPVCAFHLSPLFGSGLDRPDGIYNLALPIVFWNRKPRELTK